MTPAERREWVGSEQPHASPYSALDADELALRLKALAESGALPGPAVEVARECVRRARMAEAAELAAVDLLDDLRILCGDEGLRNLVRDGVDLRTVTSGWTPSSGRPRTAGPSSAPPRSASC